MATKEKNVEYVLYDKRDSYIAGFDSIASMSKYLGNSKPSLSRILSRSPDKRGEINRNVSEENTVDCSQRLYTYTNSVIDINGRDWGKGCSIYKFWEE